MIYTVTEPLPYPIAPKVRCWGGAVIELPHLGSHIKCYVRSYHSNACISRGPHSKKRCSRTATTRLTCSPCTLARWSHPPDRSRSKRLGSHMSALPRRRGSGPRSPTSMSLLPPTPRYTRRILARRSRRRSSRRTW